MEPQVISLFGATGLIGQSLVNHLLEDGHEIRVFSRNKDKASRIFSDQVKTFNYNSIPNDIAGSTVIINLAGENIAGKRWTARQKKRIIASRVNTCGMVIEAINALPVKPMVYLQASAIGYYPFSFEESFSEDSHPGSSFLAEVTHKWENTIKKLDTDVRPVLLRTGVVLSGKGGMLPKVALPIKLFVGGIIGSGKQWISWIHMKDEINAIVHLIKNKDSKGPYNLVSPSPVQMKDFIDATARILKRPAVIPVPSFVIKLLFGKMGKETILSSQKVVPGRLEKTGYPFEFKELKEALKDLL